MSGAAPKRSLFGMGRSTGANATWAYFFPDHLDISVGLSEVQRVVRPGGPLAVVENYGGDEFSALLKQMCGVDRD